MQWPKLDFNSNDNIIPNKKLSHLAFTFVSFSEQPTSVVLPTKEEHKNSNCSLLAVLNS